jgi:hypothetical protein
MSRKNKPVESIGVKGFFRVQIVDKKSREIVGDSGYFPNQITNYGLESVIVALPLKCANSLQCSGMMLGSGTAPASDATTLESSNTDYWSSFGQSTVVDSLTAQATQSFDGTLGAATIKNIGLFVASTGTVIAGNTFTQSTLTTDQDVNCTYQLRYTTS